MSDATSSKDEWLSQEDIAELLGRFDIKYDSSSSSDSSSGSSSESEEQPAKRQRVEQQTQQETVVVDDVSIEAINKIMDFNQNLRELDKVLDSKVIGDFPEVWHVLTTACEHIYLQLNAEVPDDARLDQLKTFVRQEVDVLLGWKPEEPDPGNVQGRNQYVDHGFDVDF